MKKLQTNHGHSPTNRANSTNNTNSSDGRKETAMNSSNTGPGTTGGNMFAG